MFVRRHVCVCVRAYVRAFLRAYVRACVRTCVRATWFVLTKVAQHFSLLQLMFYVIISLSVVLPLLSVQRMLSLC